MKRSPSCPIRVMAPVSRTTFQGNGGIAQAKFVNRDARPDDEVSRHDGKERGRQSGGAERKVFVPAHGGSGFEESRIESKRFRFSDFDILELRVPGVEQVVRFFGDDGAGDCEGGAFPGV